MKRMLLASVLAVLGATLALADDTGRAFIRSTPDDAPAMPAAVTPASAVFHRGGSSSGSCSSGSCNTCACAQPGTKDDRLGLHPLLSKLLWWKKPSCSKCGGLFGPRCNSGYGAPAFNPYPDGMPGTLVFPQHAFIRSPRDFWMADPK